MRLRLFVMLFVLLSTGVHAQWLNFAPPGTPKTRDGKPDLTARVPRMPDGKPDLSGTWMHEQTSFEEMKRIYGPLVEEEAKVGVPGMEIGTQNKYAINILLDFKPDALPMTPAGAALWKQRVAERDPAARLRHRPRDGRGLAPSADPERPGRQGRPRADPFHAQHDGRAPDAHRVQPVGPQDVQGRLAALREGRAGKARLRGILRAGLSSAAERRGG